MTGGGKPKTWHWGGEEHFNDGSIIYVCKEKGLGHKHVPHTRHELGGKLRDFLETDDDAMARIADKGRIQLYIAKGQKGHEWEGDDEETVLS